MGRFKAAGIGLLTIVAGVTQPSSPRADEAADRQQAEALILQMNRYPITYLEGDGEATGMMQCRGTSIDLWLVGLTPAQAFPQPDLSLAFTGNSWTRNPYARLSQGHPEIVVEFFASKDVMGTRQLFADLATGTPIEVSFNGQSRKLSVTSDKRATFVKGCLKGFQF